MARWWQKFTEYKFMGQRGLYIGGRAGWGHLKITSSASLYGETFPWQEMLFMNINSYTPDFASMRHLQSKSQRQCATR